MASLLSTLRNSIIDSIKGRKIGLDVNEHIVGPRAFVEQIEDLTTTAATSASYFGVTNVLTTGSSQTGAYTLQAPPVAGIRKTLRVVSTSTGTMQFQLSGSALVIGASITTVGSTVITLVRQGAIAHLMSLSTSLWMVMNQASSLVSSDGQGIIFSTST